MIPGSNLLSQALTIIARQAITYHQATGRTVNDIGQQVTTYAAPVIIYGSFQPVPRNLYEQYGLDFQKNYWTFYSLNDVQDIGRDVSNDQISFNDQRFQCESNNDWYSVDRWKGILCCQINIPQANVFGFNNALHENSNENFNNGSFYAG